MDVRAQQARENHRLSLERESQASQHREVRDRLVRLLREEDPSQWSYFRLARAIGCSPELIAYILKRKTGKNSVSGLTERKPG